MKKRFIISMMFVAVSILAGSYVNVFQRNTQIAEAAAGDVKGWLWSDNIGWVSLNCLNTASCGTAQYGVTQAANGTWSGYGWSDNIGWLEFSPSTCPSGSTEH